MVGLPLLGIPSQDRELRYLVYLFDVGCSRCYNFMHLSQVVFNSCLYHVIIRNVLRGRKKKFSSFSYKLSFAAKSLRYTFVFNRRLAIYDLLNAGLIP